MVPSLRFMHNRHETREKGSRAMHLQCVTRSALPTAPVHQCPQQQKIISHELCKGVMSVMNHAYDNGLYDGVEASFWLDCLVDTVKAKCRYHVVYVEMLV